MIEDFLVYWIGPTLSLAIVIFLALGAYFQMLKKMFK